MNKIASLLFLGFLLMFSLSETRAFNIVNNVSLATGAQCAGANITIREYFNVPFQPRDEFTSNQFVQLQPVTSPTITDPTQTTRIEVYNPSGMLNCGDMNNWIYPSIAVPANKAIPAINTVVSVAKGSADLCRIITLPPTRNDIVAQFVFVNAFRQVSSWLWAGTSWSLGITLPVPSNVILPPPTNYIITPDYILSNTIQFEQPECLNIQAAWCGDGVVDVGQETCDLGAQNGVAGSACSATCTAIVPPGGGGGNSCVPGNFVRSPGGIVPSPISATTAGLCPVGEIVGNFTDTPNGGSRRYSWSCNGIGAGLACTAIYSPGGGGWGGGGGSFCGNGVLQVGEQCDDGNTISGDGCSATCTNEGGNITTPGAGSYCGNGAVERPNAAWVYENCDTPALWCVDCNIASTNPWQNFPGSLTITTPGSSAIDIGSWKLILWDQVSVFDSQDIIAFETNTPVYLENKTATITNHSAFLNGATVSKVMNGVGVGWAIRFEVPGGRTYDAAGNLVNINYEERIYPSSLVLFQGSELQSFAGDTTTIVGSYADTVIANPTYRSQGIYASLQYLESPFNIRVSHPIVANIAGGSAFIGSPLGQSVNTVVQSFMNNLRSGNFTTSTVNVASSGLSSATSTVSGNNTLSQTIASGWVVEEGNISRASTTTVGIYAPTSITSEFQIDPKSIPLSDATNIRVFKDGDVTIDGILDLQGVKTVIVENGNLIINQDIRYANKDASFAWIVKNGNIIVADTVQNIAGVYIVLAGAIESNGVSTPNRLMVDGSLYGNTADLVANRSYVRGQTGYSALNVGVVVNYSNRALIYPPPALSRFLDQYSLQRVAR